ncbi:XRE family transcriptional regulator [Weissella confusa]|uniref:XRE family transcriptional regulator n=1 Tax=Weissella confusa TaxID=1583 RepID=UPI00107F367F|nr:XRE family transcriptional regulator [Weissella confusa]TGE67110.1 XRE family transcriptional regulator [Weissella confusa]
MTVYERIKEISKERGMSLQSVAKSAGLSQNMIYQYKKVNPKTETLRTLADVLGVSVDYLLGNTDEMHGNNKKNEPVDLDKALSEEGMAMFDGQPLSDEYKKALLAMLKTMKGNN